MPRACPLRVQALEEALEAEGVPSLKRQLMAAWQAVLPQSFPIMAQDTVRGERSLPPLLPVAPRAGRGRAARRPGDQAARLLGTSPPMHCAPHV